MNNATAEGQQSLSTSQTKIEYLDGLRGYAALVVVWTHFKELVLPGAPVHLQYEDIIQSPPVAILFSSKLAVLVFFVHSGLVLSWKYLATRDHRVLISMCLRRGLRLGIPVAASVCFAFALMRFGAMHNAEAAEKTGATRVWVESYRFEPTLRTAIVDSFGGALLYGSVRYNGALWTMPIELICSYGVFLILPLIVKLRTEHMVLAFAIASLSLLQNYPWMVCFLAGILLARLYQRGHFSHDGDIFKLIDSLRYSRLLLAVIVAVIVLFPDWSGIHLPLPQFLNPKEAVQILAAVILIFLVLVSPAAQHFLKSPVSRWLGKMSFSAYLVHLPIICSFSSWLILQLVNTAISYEEMVLTTLAATIVVVYLAAWVMTVCVDRWAITFGKKFLQQYLYPSKHQQVSKGEGGLLAKPTQESSEV